MSKWFVVAFLALQAHFAASYLVPLDGRSQREFGGLLRWLWPWSDGDGGLLGRVTVAGESPLAGVFLALGAATALGMAALAVAGWWVPAGWWRALTAAGAALLLCLMALFVGPTKVLPAAVAVATLYVVLTRPAALLAE